MSPFDLTAQSPGDRKEPGFCFWDGLPQRGRSGRNHVCER